jgi:hypothetical protein
LFETIVEVTDPAIARVLTAALKAHGFHPLEGGDDGLPGMPGVFSADGIAIRVPQEEAGDAGLLARSLLRDMQGDSEK